MTRAMRFSPDAKRIVTGDEWGSVKVWALKQERPLFERKAHDGIVRVAGFSPDGTRLCSGGGEDGGVKLWEAKEGRLLGEYRFAGRILAHHFVRSGGPLLVASARRGGDQPEIHNLA
jgi:WD40 repeat protein